MHIIFVFPWCRRRNLPCDHCTEGQCRFRLEKDEIKQRRLFKERV